jgi:sugar lactone lactonase YvrE
MYIVASTGDEINEYNLSTAWDISTASFVQLFSVSGQESLATGLEFKPDGTKMYIVGSNGDEINEYNLSTAWDISTASFVQLFSVASRETSPQAIAFRPDGLRIFIIGQLNDKIFQYDLSTPWNISTAIFSKDIRVSHLEISPNGLAFKADGTKLYFVGSSSDTVYEWNLG